ncbi:hypothetical protein Tco_0143785 [Tanacetum coccineum]
MTTLADKSLLSDGDNKPPMLEKHLYDSWKSIIELYMMNRPHGRMILALVEKGPLVWPTITVDGVTRPKEYTELTPAETIQADCDIKAINIILQGLPTEIYALIQRISLTGFPAQSHLRQTLSEQLREKESLMKTVNVLKDDFKKEESRNIDREIALEKKIKHLDNIVYKRDQLAQTVHMLTKPKFFYDHSTKQALDFQNPFYLKKAQQLESNLYDGNVIKNICTIEIPDSEETLMLAEESRSKMLLKQQDPIVLHKKNSMTSSDPCPSSTTNKVEVPKELPKVSMVNTSLKKLKHHMAGFDKVVKERTTATAITEGTWGFEHTKACFRDVIIPFVKALKDIFNKFDQDLIDELTEVQTIFIQMEQAVEQHRL